MYDYDYVVNLTLKGGKKVTYVTTQLPWWDEEGRLHVHRWGKIEKGLLKKLYPRTVTSRPVSYCLEKRDDLWMFPTTREQLYQLQFAAKINN